MPHKLSESEEARRLEVWNRHLTDGESGKLLDVPCDTYRAWRKRRHLQPLGKRRYVADEEQERRIRVWDLRLTDGESAKKLGMKATAYSGWRLKHDLPASNPDGDPDWLWMPRTLEVLEKGKYAYALRRQGLDDDAIAEKMRVEQRDLYARREQVRFWIGRYLQSICRVTPACPYRALLPEAVVKK